MTAEGVDYLVPGLTAAELKAAGKSFVMRYLDRTDYPSLSAPEAASLHAAGIDVGCIAEWGAQRMLGGAAAGTLDGMRAKKALAALGAPAGTVVYFAADWPADATQFPAIDAYLTAAGSVLGHAAVGVYGGLQVIRHCIASKSASHFWQTYAWSGTPTVWAIGTHLQQYRNTQTLAGHGVDLDRAMVAAWGQWAAASTGAAAMGLSVHLAATAGTPSLAAFGTAKIKGTGHAIVRVATGAYKAAADGFDLGLVQLGTLIPALPGGVAGADRTNVVVTNVDGEIYVALRMDVAFTPLPAPADQTAALAAATAELKAANDKIAAAKAAANAIVAL